MTFQLVEFPTKTSSVDSAASSTLRAFAVLEQIAEADDSLTLEELTRISGLPKPTVHRILRLLMRGRLVERQALDKRYVVGPRVSALAPAVQMRSPHRRERRAILARLVEIAATLLPEVNSRSTQPTKKFARPGGMAA
ncbi:MAG: helix-turn-helix domain-containing protein [Burkholderiaceae bacterium]